MDSSPSCVFFIDVVRLDKPIKTYNSGNKEGLKVGNNLYTPSFGKSPAQHITRVVELNTIKETFNNTPPNQQAYIITGVRGSGKTVLMTDISKEPTISTTRTRRLH